MTYGETRIINYCREHPECSNALLKLYQAKEGEWQNISNLRTVCGIDRAVWMGFNFRCGARQGEGIIETEVGNRAGHMKNVRITAGKHDRVKLILTTLYGDDF